MKNLFSTKSIDGGVLDVDKSTRSVKVAFNKAGVLDRDNDVILKTAFNRTFKARGPEGTNEIWKLIDHTASMKTQLGKPKELGMDGDFAYGVTNYKNTFLWREVMWPTYEAGEVTQHSFGFSIVDDERKDDYRIIKEVAMWEYSAVLWGANASTPTMEIAKQIGIYHEDDEIPVRIERMQKALKSDKFNPDDIELFNIELLQLKSEWEKVNQKSNTDTVENTTPPALIEPINWKMVAALINL